MSFVCNLSEAVFEKAFQKGFQQGFRQGFEKGQRETILAAVKNLVGTLKLSMEQAMDALQLSPTERLPYAELLKE